MGPPAVPNGPRSAPSGPRGAPSSAPTGPRGSATATGSSSSQASSSGAATEPDIDLASIKARYLGIEADPNKKRKTRKMSDKKFVFDWDGDEDTASGASLLPSLGVGVMLGGTVAGMGDAGRGRTAGAASSTAAPDQ